MGLLARLRSFLPPREEINIGRRVPTFLYRWEIVSILGGQLRVYLHKFVGSDGTVDLHDHPKRFWSIGLRGWYREHLADGTTRVYRAPWIRTFPAEHRHRTSGPTPQTPCWTLVVVGQPVREWGFWVPFERGLEFVGWKTYVAPGSAYADAGVAAFKDQQP